MNQYVTALLFAAASTTTALAADVGVSVSVGQPGFYGRIDIGSAPPPVLIHPQPVIIQRVHAAPSPIYLRVPPGHAKKWSKHCQKYDACGRPVYFVQDDWYTNVYVPHHQSAHSGSSHGKGQGKGQGKGKNK